MSGRKEIPIADLVVAYEMRSDDICWKLIGRWLGHSWSQIKDAVETCERGGLRDIRVIIKPEVVSSAMRMRENSRLGYQSIADHLGVDKNQLIYAIGNRTRPARRLAAKQRKTQ